MQCPKCGSWYDREDRFCRNCGDPLHAGGGPGTPEPVQGKQRTRLMKALNAASAAVVLLALLAVTLAKVAPELLKAAGFAPRDLGVTWDDADLASILSQCGIEEDAAPDSADRSAYRYEFDGEQAIDWTFTEAELTAWMNSPGHPGYWPFGEAQVKLHGGNEFELSFVLNPVKLLSYPSVIKYIPADVKSTIAGIPLQLPVYLKARVDFTAPGEAAVKMLDFDTAGMSVSGIALSDQTNAILTSILNEELASAPQVSVELFETGEGSLHMKGSWYTGLTRVPNE